MTKRLIFSQFCILLTIVITTLSASGKETISFVYFNDYPPFGWEENGTMRGIYIDIVDEVFTNRLNIPVTHRGLPWKRAQLMVFDGTADGFCTAITPKRLKFTEATQQSIIEVNFKIFVPVNGPGLERLRHVSDLSGLKAFKLVDYAGSGWAQKNLVDRGLNVHWLQRNEQIWKFLLLGRADATVNNEWTTRYALKKEGLQEQILELPHPMTSEPISFHIFIGKKSPFHPILEQVDASLGEMKADGTLQRIHQIYK
ncbi:MAG: transporter substrate-binding domain-containing protein [Desulfobacterales bacterium]|nr:transporter substrate-binding domain-containing protein [Desulfobacterales bacterium]